MALRSKWGRWLGQGHMRWGAEPMWCNSRPGPTSFSILAPEKWVVWYRGLRKHLIGPNSPWGEAASSHPKNSLLGAHSLIHSHLHATGIWCYARHWGCMAHGDRLKAYVPAQEWVPWRQANWRCRMGHVQHYTGPLGDSHAGVWSTWGNMCQVWKIMSKEASGGSGMSQEELKIRSWNKQRSCRPLWWPALVC